MIKDIVIDTSWDNNSYNLSKLSIKPKCIFGTTANVSVCANYTITEVTIISQVFRSNTRSLIIM